MSHVLITRPKDAGQQLASALSKHGLTAIVMPLYTFVARAPSLDLSVEWSTRSTRKLAVFTSPRAVQFGLEYLPADPLKGVEIAVVGSATRNQLESCGQRVHLQSREGFTSEHLLQMPEMAVDPGVAVIFCAPGGRDALDRGLAAMGWRVSKALVYERKALQPLRGHVDSIEAAQKLLSVWTSTSALKLAENSLPERTWRKILMAPALVISSRIQHYLQHRGARRVEVANGPGNPELLQSILRMTGQSNTG